ncbi:MAG TPA: hypothetical protein VN706_13790 [Gemmatimonadaceae bacterium]|nr:hypothetical protein [Gemmatimonadaceae bacterium]
MSQVNAIATGERSAAHHTAGKSTGLRVIVLVLMAAPFITAMFAPPSRLPALPRALAFTLWVASLAPAWTYLGKPLHRRPPLPFMPLIGLLYGLNFALQLALGQVNVFYRIGLDQMSPLDPRHDYTAPITLALVGWLILLGVYTLIARRNVSPTAFVNPPRSAPALRRRLVRSALMLLYCTVVLEPLRVLGVPLVLHGILVFMQMLGLFALGLLIVMQLQGVLPKRAKLMLYAGLAAMVVGRLATGQISGLALLAVTVLEAYWLAKGSVGWRAIVGVLVVGVAIVTLRGLAVQFRAVVWFGGTNYTLGQRLTVLHDVAQDRVASDGVWGTITDGATLVAGRSAYADIFADVYRLTPRYIKYWNGGTYVALIGVAIPRALWPSKPVSSVGQMFGHRYNYIGDFDFGTSVNLPYLLEFFVNFGPMGVLFGMAAIGSIYAFLERVVNRPGQPPELSMAGAALLLPLLNIESDFAVTFGGLLMNGVALWLVYRQLVRVPRPKAVVAVHNTVLGAAT